jgi:hypothetical protein
MAIVETIQINYNNHFPFNSENYQNLTFKFYPNIFKSSIPRHLELKESIINIDSIYGKLSIGIKLDTIEIPANIKKIARDQLGIIINDFKPGFKTSNKVNITNELEYNVIKLISQNYQLDEKILLDETKQKLSYYLHDYMRNEMLSCIGVNYRVNNIINTNLSDIISNITSEKTILVYGKNLLDSIIFIKEIGCIFGSNYVILINIYTNLISIINNSELLIINGDNYAHVKFSVVNSNLMVNSICKSSSMSQITKGVIKDDNTVEIIYNYKNNIGTNVFVFHKKFANDDEYEIYNKNGLIVQSKYNSATKTEHIISKYTLSDEKTGLRFRGKVEIENKGKSQVSKKISIDDETQYEKSGNKVLVDKLSNLKLSNEMIIGWKAVKNANGDKRIIKLAIPPDARTLIPIDEEYFLNNQKERADQAIVMDIQLPDEHDEISVVPHETVAYSYIYSNEQPFEYKIGKLVKPNGFNENPDIGCGKGIHFFRSKGNLFKSYLN